MHQRKMIPNLQVVLVMNPKLEAGLACRSLPLLLEQLFCMGMKAPCNRLLQTLVCYAIEHTYFA